MRHRAASLVVLLIAASVGVVASEDVPEKTNSQKPRPWQWSDKERLAERSNDASAARRVAAHATPDLQDPYDVIDGSRDPQLFFEFELFDGMMRLAYADDPATREAYRASKDAVRQSIGLPADFWERVGAITAAYRKDRLEERRLGRAAVRSRQHEAEQRAVSLLLCRDSLAALASLRQEFPRFHEFLYTAVAPTMSSTILRRPDLKLQQIVRGECQ